MIRAVLAGLAVGLGGLLLYQWRDWPPSPPAGAPTQESAAAAHEAPELSPLNRLSAPEPRESYASISERTLFRPQRRPEAPEAEEPAPQPEQEKSLDGVDLSAVVIAPSIVSAWVSEPGGKALKRLRPGDELNGWTIKEIQSERLVLERQGERNELILRDFSKAPAAAPQPLPTRGPAVPLPGRPPGPGVRTPNTNQGPNPAMQQAPSRPPVRPPNAKAGPDRRIGQPVSPPPRPNARRPTPQSTQ